MHKQRGYEHVIYGTDYVYRLAVKKNVHTIDHTIAEKKRIYMIFVHFFLLHALDRS